MVLDELLSAVCTRSRAPASRPAASVCVYLYRNTAFGFPYSPATQVSEGLTQRYGFQGREASAHAGAGAPMYYRNRQYNPGLGRFGRRDPLLGGDPLFNAYGFPGTDGINWLDPFGLEKTLTVYADQPKPGERAAYSAEFDPKKSINVGHTFVALEDTDNKVSMVYGFYPAGDQTPITPEGPGLVDSDDGHTWTAKKAFTLTDDQYCAAKEYIETSKATPPKYNLNSFNCTTWAVAVAEKAGQKVPKVGRFWGVGYGLSPGSFGEDLAEGGGERHPKYKDVPTSRSRLVNVLEQVPRGWEMIP